LIILLPMEIDFQEKMAGKTNEALLTYIDNIGKYVPEAINAAVAELQERGHVFSVDELKKIQTDIELKVRRQNFDESVEYTYSNDMAIFPDDKIEVYYSKSAIVGFSIFIATLFGAVLFAINVRKNKTHAVIVTLFGVAYMVLISYVVTLPPEKIPFLSYLLNAVGGFILTGIFWPMYIGKNVKYRSREIWGPLLVAIAVTLFYVFFILNLRVK